jgi:membrane protease YdiL (CAAX protease family)
VVPWLTVPLVQTGAGVSGGHARDEHRVLRLPIVVYWGNPASMVVLAPVWLYMGYAYAVIVRRTGSLGGPLLAHAIADVIYMYTYFAKA